MRADLFESLEKRELVSRDVSMNEARKDKGHNSRRPNRHLSAKADEQKRHCGRLHTCKPEPC